ncbi:MAG: OmpA family protein [Saprospiraceae bacterium]|nr:OmpA family protein [Saprospiraceae bacterium]
MAKITYFVYILLAVGILTSCVPNRKYQDEVKSRQNAQAEAAQERTARVEAEEATQVAQAKIKDLEDEYEELKKDFDKLKKSYDTQQELSSDNENAFRNLQSKYKETFELLESLREERNECKEERNNYRDERDRIQVKYETLKSKHERLEDRIKELEDANDKLRKDLEGNLSNLDQLENYKKELERDLADREKRVKELEAALAERDAKAKALRQKLQDALKGFSSSDLAIEERGGKVYVSMSQKLLFSSGSSKVGSEGKKALIQLAAVLEDSKELNILVEGHTDSDGDAKMNWDLSTKRALSIVDVLIDNKVSPSQLTAAGRGEHAPKASNDTSEGKATNRRTEIILSPQLDVISEILNN